MGLARVALTLKPGESFAQRRRSCFRGQIFDFIMAFVAITAFLAIDVVMVEFGGTRHIVVLAGIAATLVLAGFDIWKMSRDIRAIDSMLDDPHANLIATALGDSSLNRR